MGFVIYVDGSCQGNPGPGGFGAVVVKDGIAINAYKERFDNTTNNRMEMRAIIWALENYGIPDNKMDIPIVYSDSAYCVNSFNTWIKGWATNGWKRAKNKPLENLDLIKKYYQLINNGYSIDLRKVQGHSGIRYNELADRLATDKITVEEALKIREL